jgi:hypothetical protein
MMATVLWESNGSQARTQMDRILPRMKKNTNEVTQLNRQRQRQGQEKRSCTDFFAIYVGCLITGSLVKRNG